MKKRIVFILLTLALLLCLCPAFASADESGQCGDDLYWSFNSSTGTLTITGSGGMEDYTSSTQPWASVKNSIRTVVLPDGLTHIGNYAFRACFSLSSITIPSSVTGIGEYAFSFTNVRSVTVPGGVTNIGNDAFSSCSNLQSIQVEEGNRFFSSVDGVLFSYDKTRLLTYPGGREGGYIIPEGVTDIGDKAFSYCGKLTSITIPSDVMTIGTGAFNYCERLSFVEIPDGMTSIGNSMFNGCKGLTSITIPDSVVSIGYSAFYGCSGLASIAIPNSVTRIGFSAFYGCTSLTSVNIPQKITNIELGTFSNCTGLTAVTIPALVRTISYTAFSGCSGLLSVTLPNKLTSVESSAFQGCSALSTVRYQGTETDRQHLVISSGNDSLLNADWQYMSESQSCGSNLYWSFDEATGVLSIVGSGAMNSYSYTNTDRPWESVKDQITGISLYPGLYSIGSYAFRECTALTSVVIPEGVVEIGTGAFENCTALETIDIPEGVTSFGGFEGCTSLRSITIPSTVNYIGYIPFTHCPSLTSIEVRPGNQKYASVDGVLFSYDQKILITYPAGKQDAAYSVPDGVTKIESYAFADCQRLTSVSLPASLTSVGGYAFSRCTGLTSIQIDEDNQTYVSENGVLLSRDRTKLIRYPAGMEIQAYAVPDGVTQIGKAAFSDNAFLTKIVIPESVATIEYAAFNGCSALTDVFYAGTFEQQYDIDVNNDYSLNDAFLNANWQCKSPCGPDLCWFFNPVDNALTISGSGVMTNYTRSTNVNGTNIVATSTPWQAYSEEIQKVILLDGVTSVGQASFNNCYHLVSVSLPETITTIGWRAFSGCSQLSSIRIPSGVTNIENYAFSGCWSLTSLAIPDSLNIIRAYVFSGCSALKSVTIPDSVGSIDENAFSNCTDLINLTLGNRVTSISKGAFTGCTNLRSVYYHGTSLMRSKITIGSNNSYLTSANWYYILPFSGPCGEDVQWTYSDGGVLTISGSGAMPDYASSNGQPWARWREQIYSLVIDEGVTNVSNNAFSDCSNLSSVQMADSVKTIGNKAFFGCTDLETVSISIGTVTIGDDAFYDCSRMSVLTLPEGLETIGQFAFCNCMGLKAIILPSSVTTVAEGAFNYCTGLNTVNYMGKEEQRAQISIGSSNEYLLNATWHYLTVACIEMKSLPNTLTYPEGAALAASYVTGGVVLVKYNNDETVELVLTADMISGFDPTVVGVQTLTVTYEGKTTTFQVTVEHVPGEPVRENEVAPTVEEEGSYDMAVYCTVCGAEVSRVRESIPKLPVTFTGVVTCRDGRNVYLQNGETAKLALLDSSNSQVNMDAVQKGKLVTVTGEAMTYRQGGYRIPEIMDAMIVEVADTNTAVAPTVAAIEDLGDGLMARLVQVRTTKQALVAARLQLPLDEYADLTTLVVTGVLSANSDGRILLDPIIVSEHTPGEPVQENIVPATCAAEGSYDEVVYCVDCGMELSRERRIIEKSNVHTPGEPVQENVTPGTGSAHGSCDEVVYCTVCGVELSRETKGTPKVVGAFTLTVEPRDVTAFNGDKAIFAVTVNNVKGVKYQWYTRANAGAAWKKASSGTKAVLSVKAELKANGSQYYCEITTPDGKLTSDIATLTVQLREPVVKTQPKNVKAKSGSKVKLSVKATGLALSYQWFSRPGEDAEWAEIEGATDAAYTFVPWAEDDGWQFRCRVSNSGGEAWSDAATLTVTAQPAAVKSPLKDVKAKSGAKPKLTVKAGGPDLSYQWYSRPNADAEWQEIEGAAAATYTFTPWAANDGWQFRCHVWNPDGDAWSNEATLFVTAQPAAVKTSPKNAKVKSGAKPKFTVKAAGPNVEYQWYSRPNADAEWTEIDGATAATYTFTPWAENDGWQFRCHVWNPDGDQWSDEATLTVTPQPASVKTSPKDAKVKLGAKAKFTVKGAGPDLRYQWYTRASEDAGWVLIEGATKAEYTVNAAEDNIGSQYRCHVWNPDGDAWSDPAALLLK